METHAHSSREGGTATARQAVPLPTGRTEGQGHSLEDHSEVRLRLSLAVRSAPTPRESREPSLYATGARRGSIDGAIIHAMGEEACAMGYWPRSL